MQHTNELTMEQSVFHLVTHFLVDMPRVSRFQHLHQWTFANCAYEYLAVSTAASSPSRRAAVDVAQRLFIMQLRMDHRELAEEAAALERRIHRAVMLSGLPVNHRGPVENVVRMVANEYRIERGISSRVLRSTDEQPFTRAAAQRLYRIMRETLRQDVDSNTEESDLEGSNTEESDSEG